MCRCEITERFRRGRGGGGRELRCGPTEVLVALDGEGATPEGLDSARVTVILSCANWARAGGVRIDQIVGGSEHARSSVR